MEISGSSSQCDGKISFSRYCGFTFSTDITSDRDQDFDNLDDLSLILQRSHETICGKSTFFIYIPKYLF